MQVLVGTPNDDEIIGAYTSEVLIGGPGADTLCGGLGNDTVDYSSSTQPVRVTLDGDMPTDPDLGIQLLPDHFGESGEALRQRFFKARHDCRQTNPADGLPVTPGDRDCTADDGPLNPVTGVSTDTDCVGEDVENIIGIVFRKWPGALLTTASSAALTASALTLLGALLLPAVWRGAPDSPRWTTWHQSRYTAAVVIFAAFAVLLVAWGALEPWAS